MTFEGKLPKLRREIASELSSMVPTHRLSWKQERQSQQDLLRLLDSTSFEDLLSCVSSCTDPSLEALQRAESGLRSKRTEGIRKYSTKFQEFAKTFEQFLNAYSGIVNIMNSADC